MAVLQALASMRKAAALKKLQASLPELIGQSNVVLQWIPSHCSIPRNEEADNPVKQGDAMPQTQHSYHDAKIIIQYTAEAEETVDTNPPQMLSTNSFTIRSPSFANLCVIVDLNAT